MQQYNIVLEEKQQVVTKEVLSVEERAAQMEQLHRDQEKHLKVSTPVKACCLRKWINT